MTHPPGNLEVKPEFIWTTTATEKNILGGYHLTSFKKSSQSSGPSWFSMTGRNRKKYSKTPTDQLRLYSLLGTYIQNEQVQSSCRHTVQFTKSLCSGRWAVFYTAELKWQTYLHPLGQQLGVLCSLLLVLLSALLLQGNTPALMLQHSRSHQSLDLGSLCSGFLP